MGVVLGFQTDPHFADVFQVAGVANGKHWSKLHWSRCLHFASQQNPPGDFAEGIWLPHKR